MIVNTQLNLPQSSGIMDSQQCDGFYLKRKLGPDDQIDNANGYIQAKKRHLQGYSPTNNNFQVLPIEEPHQQEQQQNCSDLHFNLNSSAFINDLFNYDHNLVPVQTNFANDQFDGNWQNADLLELDHRYNSGLAVIAAEAQQPEAQQDAITDNMQLGQLELQQHHQQQQEEQQNLTVFTLQKKVLTHDEADRHSTNGAANSVNNGPFNSDAESDFEDKNLSWLFNFKLDELPHLSPEVNQPQTQPSVLRNSAESTPKSQSKSQSKTGKKFEELVMEVTSELDANDMIVAENVVVENSPRMPKKPPFTYTELIEYALEDKGELTVSGIYQWISDRFPFYKSNDDRWKNSVRHNLSINPHFRKGAKAPQGAGHLWTISSGDSEENILAWEHKKQRLDLFFKMESMQREKQASSPSNREQSQQMFDEAAMAAATITQEMQTSMSPDQSSASCSPSTCDRLGATTISAAHELPFNDLISDEDLRKTAGQILNGIHRDVEVQAVNSIISTYHDSLLDSEDYLNPIHKDVSVHEGSLRNDFYVTEIDPIELGIHMSQVEEEVLFNDEFNLNYFGYNTGNDIVA